MGTITSNWRGVRFMSMSSVLRVGLRTEVRIVGGVLQRGAQAGEKGLDFARFQDAVLDHQHRRRRWPKRRVGFQFLLDRVARSALVAGERSWGIHSHRACDTSLRFPNPSVRRLFGFRNITLTNDARQRAIADSFEVAEGADGGGG